MLVAGKESELGVCVLANEDDVAVVGGVAGEWVPGLDVGVCRWEGADSSESEVDAARGGGEGVGGAGEGGGGHFG